MFDGFPCMCMTTMPQAELAHVASIAGSAVRPETSLMIFAPALRAAAATQDFCVSMEMRPSQVSRSDWMRGMVLSISVAAGTGLAPGRVDSPPISMMDAPWAIISRACRRAASRFVNWPPSVKESGVVLRMPMRRL